MVAIPLDEDTFADDPFSPLIEDDRGLPQPQASRGELKLMGQLQEKIEHASRARKSREYGWEYNRLMLRGEQYVGQVAATGEVVRLVFEDETESLPSTDNLLLETARAAVGKYIRIIPSVVVLPRTEDRSDMRAAEVIDSFADFQWRNLQMKLKYKRAMEYMMWAGTAPFEVCWDKHKGRMVSYCAECGYSSDVEKPGQPCPLCLVTQADPMALASGASPEQASPNAPVLKRVREGDVSLILHDPRSYFPEPGVAEIEDMQWSYTQTAQPVNLLRRRYPDKAGLIRSQEGIYSESNAIYALGTSSARYDTQPLRGHAYEYRVHLAPSGKQPSGSIVTIVNDRIMRVDTSPYYEMFDQLPFVALRGDREARVFWGIPPCDNSTSLQKERNTLSTQTREHRELTNNPKLLVGEMSGIDVDRMSTVPGEVLKIKATPFGRPAYLVPPPLSQYVYAEFERLAGALRRKFGVTDNEAGIAPADQSGRLGAILEAQGNEAISPIVLENLEAWIKINHFVILTGMKYYAPSRMWAVRGQDMPRSYSWGRVGDIKPGWNLMLADEDALSKNPALRLQQAVLLWDKGVYLDPATGRPNIKKFLRHANLRMPGMIPDSEGAHRAYAASIPEKIKSGEPFMPKPWDDAIICAEELCEWLRTEGNNAAEPVVRTIFNIWVIYAQAALALGADPRTLPNPGLQAPQQQVQGGNGAPGAPAELPAGQGPGAPPATASGEARQLVQQADASAEGSARASSREGSTL